MLDWDILCEIQRGLFLQSDDLRPGFATDRVLIFLYVPGVPDWDTDSLAEMRLKFEIFH